jgi:hypothetical protein
MGAGQIDPFDGQRQLGGLDGAGAEATVAREARAKTASSEGRYGVLLSSEA